MNNFDEYQEFTQTTAVYPVADALAYTTCGLVGEACEFAAKVQKLVEKTYVDIQQKFLTETSDKVRDDLLTQLDTARRLNSVLLEASALLVRAESLKKDIRGGKIKLPPLINLTNEQRLELAKEISDSCWYISQSSKALNYKLSEIFKINVDKLSSRKERGVIHGSGDNR